MMSRLSFHCIVMNDCATTSLRSSQSTCEKRTTINETASVGRGHVPADREAADGRHEQVCTYLVVPTLGGDMSPPYRGCFGNGKIANAVGREMPLTRPTVARG